LAQSVNRGVLLVGRSVQARPLLCAVAWSRVAAARVPLCPCYSVHSAATVQPFDQWTIQPANDLANQPTFQPSNREANRPTLKRANYSTQRQSILPHSFSRSIPIP